MFIITITIKMQLLVFVIFIVVALKSSTSVPVGGGETGCNEIVTSCAGDDFCREAMENVETICQVIEFRCAAKFHNLPKCAAYMDILLSGDYFGQECSCKPGSSSECADGVTLIKNNACFRSVKHLRLVNKMPTNPITPKAPTKAEVEASSGNSTNDGLPATTPTPSPLAVYIKSLYNTTTEKRRRIAPRSQDEIYENAEADPAEPEQYLALNLFLIVFIIAVIVVASLYVFRRSTRVKEDPNTKEPLVT